MLDGRNAYLGDGVQRALGRQPAVFSAIAERIAARGIWQTGDNEVAAMNTLTTTAIIVAIIGTGLIGGIFFAFSNFIMKALERVPSSQGILAMQMINVTVLNRWFLGVFMGTAVLSLILAIVAIVGWRSAGSPYLLGGAMSYIAGTWLVTALGNVPLNNKLADVGADDPASSSVWEDYLSRWTALNSRRTGAALVAAVLFSIGLHIGM